MESTLWNHWKDGPCVQVINVDGNADVKLFQVLKPEGPELYSSAKALVMALTDEGYSSWPILGQAGPTMPIFDLLQPGGIIVDQGGLRPIKIVASPLITIVSPAPVITLGIDLAVRGHEVRKLLFKGFSSWMFSAGHDPEEVYQEVCKGILIRNKGKGAFNPARSSFGHYVHQVCGCILSNWHRRESRRRSHEQVGIKELKNNTWTDIDAAESGPDKTQYNSQPIHTTQTAEDDLLAYMAKNGAQRSPIGRLALRILPHVAQGLSRIEIVAILGGPKKVLGGKASIGKAMEVIKTFAAQWTRLDG